MAPLSLSLLTLLAPPFSDFKKYNGSPTTTVLFQRSPCHHPLLSLSSLSDFKKWLHRIIHYSSLPKGPASQAHQTSLLPPSILSFSTFKENLLMAFLLQAPCHKFIPTPCPTLLVISNTIYSSFQMVSLDPFLYFYLCSIESDFKRTMDILCLTSVTCT